MKLKINIGEKNFNRTEFKFKNRRKKKEKKMKKQLFSTDLKRLTEILAINLYSDPFVPIRELLQNANDACLMREGF